MVLPASKNATWQEYVAKSVTSCRQALLLAHPNAVPLMMPGRMRPWDLRTATISSR
jgi:hypothetical protein